jgi:NAD+ synthase (glutamine-hydrolysing)
MKLALAQINPTVGDFPGNTGLIERFVRRAAGAGAGLVVFPELAVCGYPPEDLLHRPRFVAESRRALEAVAAACRDVVAVVGFPEGAGGKVHNAAAVLRDGAVADVYRKAELPNYGVFDEHRYFTPGSAPVVFEVGGIRFLPSICEDIWVPGGPLERWARETRPGVVLNLSASPFHAGKLAERRAVLARFARAVGASVCYANLVGGQDELVFDGGSLAIDPGGFERAIARRFAEDLLLVDLARLPLGGAGLVRDAVDPEPAPHPEPGRLDEVLAALVLGTRDYVRKNRFGKVVVGLSGGVDSALTAAVAVEALGAEDVVGVTMPSRYNARETRDDARVVARNLGIRFLELPIQEVHERYLEALAGPFGPGDPGVAGENLQARIRGNLLMGLSNRFGWLVLTTGNKSETAVGYCTLYGDMAGGFAVIKDVPKTLVWELARRVNERACRAVIPESTIARVPSAELRPDQRDEDSLPPYPVLDPILRAYVEELRSPAEIVALGFEAAVVERVVALVDGSEYKRRQAPPGVKITPLAFGRDRRLPITNRWSDRLAPGSPGKG